MSLGFCSGCTIVIFCLLQHVKGWKTLKSLARRHTSPCPGSICVHVSLQGAMETDPLSKVSAPSRALQNLSQ